MTVKNNKKKKIENNECNFITKCRIKCLPGSFALLIKILNVPHGSHLVALYN